jgi:hypothetical protein
MRHIRGPRAPFMLSLWTGSASDRLTLQQCAETIITLIILFEMTPAAFLQTKTAPRLSSAGHCVVHTTKETEI